MKRISETDMANAVRDILARQPNHTATISELRDLIPQYVHLSRADRAKSPTRPNEEVWEQIVRNLVSHKHEGFVHVQGGLRLQWRGHHRVIATQHERRAA